MHRADAPLGWQRQYLPATCRSDRRVEMHRSDGSRPYLKLSQRYVVTACAPPPEPFVGPSLVSVAAEKAMVEIQMLIRDLRFAFVAAIAISGGSAWAQAVTPTPELDACRSTGLIALRERNPSIKDVSFDVDGMTVAKANTKVEDTPIRTIVIGDAYLEKGKKDSRRTFLCLIGDKGKVLLTFFTDK